MACSYLIDILFDVGPTDASGLGGRLSEPAIQAWQGNRRTPLAPWEARMLVRLSSVWINQIAEAEEPECPAPYAVISTSQRELVARKVDELLG